MPETFLINVIFEITREAEHVNSMLYKIKL